MKKILATIWVMIFFISVTGCSVSSDDGSDYRTNTHIGALALKILDKTEEESLGKGKFIKKWTDKNEKEYTWIFYKLLKYAELVTE